MSLIHDLQRRLPRHPEVIRNLRSHELILARLLEEGDGGGAEDVVDRLFADKAAMDGFDSGAKRELLAALSELTPKAAGPAVGMDSRTLWGELRSADVTDPTLDPNFSSEEPPDHDSLSVRFARKPLLRPDFRPSVMAISAYEALMALSPEDRAVVLQDLSVSCPGDLKNAWNNRVLSNAGHRKLLEHLPIMKTAIEEAETIFKAFDQARQYPTVENNVLPSATEYFEKTLRPMLEQCLQHLDLFRESYIETSSEWIHNSNQVISVHQKELAPLQAKHQERMAHLNHLDVENPRSDFRIALERTLERTRRQYGLR